MKLLRGRIAVQYIFFDMVPSFLMGLLVFIFIILMFQTLRLTEFVLIHGVSLKTVGQMMMYLSISFLPALLPMSLLFAVLLTYGRLSADSEIVAFKSVGLNMFHLALPAILLSLLVAAVSAQVSFNLAPWGNRQFEVLITKLGNTKASATIREGTFSEGFFDMVVYANKVDSKNGFLEKVFIYDERQADMPVTIIARQGQLIQDPEFPGNLALLRLQDGDIHRKGETHTKIKFDTYDIRLFDPVKEDTKDKSPQSYTLSDIQEGMNNPQNDANFKRTLLTEWHKRWGVAAVCVIFALLGVGLGTSANRRASNSGGLVMCLGLIVLFWVLFIASDSLARNGSVPVGLALWTPNILFAAAALWRMKIIWN